METKPVSKRRWLRYSLRTLFVCITLLAIGLAWVARERSESQRQLRIAEQLKTSGAHVEFAGAYDIGLLDNPPVKEQSWWRKSLGLLIGQRIFNVDVSGRAIIDDLTSLTGLKQLQLLRLESASLDDISPLAEIPNLKWLGLNGTQVSDLAPLANLDNLELLYVRGTQVRDLAPIRALKNLKDLDLSFTQVSDAAPLAEFKNFESLDLVGTRVSDLSPLAGLANLERLDLSATQVSDEQIASLQKSLPNFKITIHAPVQPAPPRRKRRDSSPRQE
jgi:hypothetical protein